MKRSPLYKLFPIVLSCGVFLLESAEARAAEADWPQWRGPLGTGVAPEADPPVEWSETKNVRWKVALPGKGHSTPIVWGGSDFPDDGDSLWRGVACQAQYGTRDS